MDGCKKKLTFFGDKCLFCLTLLTILNTPPANVAVFDFTKSEMADHTLKKCIHSFFTRISVTLTVKKKK